jgi:Cytochrome bd terminal oxidase subunit II
VPAAIRFAPARSSAHLYHTSFAGRRYEGNLRLAFEILTHDLASSKSSPKAAVAPLKTTGDLNLRARPLAALLWPFLVALTAISLAVTLAIRPGLLANYRRLPVLYVIPAAVALSLLNMWRSSRKRNERGVLLSSCAYLVFMLAGAAAAVYPNLSTTDLALNITIQNAHSGQHSLSIGLIWWSLGMAIAIGYFVFVYRMFRGKVTAAPSIRRGNAAAAIGVISSTPLLYSALIFSVSGQRNEKVPPAYGPSRR